MALAIYKYPLEVEPHQTLLMPRGAKALSVQMQHDKPTLWALINPDDHAHLARKVWLIPTGEKIRYDDQLAAFAKMDFVGTVQDGPYVWHFFIDRE